MKRLGGADVTHAITAGTQLKALKELSNMFLMWEGCAIYLLACHNSFSKQLHRFSPMTVTANDLALQTKKFELNQIICSSFGYDMTIVEFYVVARMTKASVWLRPIGRNVTGDDGRGEGKAVPDSSWQASDNNVFRKRIQHWDNVEGISDSIKYFRIWDGKPQYHNTWD